MATSDTAGIPRKWTAIAACEHVDEIKSLSDKAAALKEYARRHKDPALEQWVSEIRIRAKRRIGELSAALETVQGERHELRPSVGTKSKLAALARQKVA